MLLSACFTKKNPAVINQKLGLGHLRVICVHYCAEAFASMKQIKCLVDVLELEGVCDVFINLEFTSQVAVHQLGHINAGPVATKGCSTPHTTCATLSSQGEYRSGNLVPSGSQNWLRS